MEAMLGSSVLVFICITVILFGGASFMMGQALADTWRPAWQNVLYGALLGVADRFFIFALFGGELLSVTGYLIHTLVIIVIAVIAYRITRAHRMVAQYPWLYERTGLFSWREKAAS